MKKSLDLKERIDQLDGERKPGEVKVLNLDSCKAENLSAVKELMEKHTSLTELSLINVGLNSLAPFPKLPTLRKLWLCDNKISGGLDHLVAACQNLEILYLGGNKKIATVEILEPLRNLASLRTLDVFACNIVSVDAFNDKIWAMLPQLVNLDSFDRQGTEIPDSEGEDDEAGDDDEYGDTSEDDVNDENNGMEFQEMDGGDSDSDDESAEEEESGSGDGDENSDEAGENAGPADSSSGPSTNKGLKRKIEE